MNWDLKKEKLNFLTHHIFIVITLLLFVVFAKSYECYIFRVNILACAMLYEWQISIWYKSYNSSKYSLNIIFGFDIHNLLNYSSYTRIDQKLKAFYCIHETKMHSTCQAILIQKEKLFCQCKWIKINGAKTTLANCFHSTRMYDDMCPFVVF